MIDLTTYAAPVAVRLIAAEQTVAVSESSGGGLISASLLAVPGASAYFLGGGVVYTLAARGALLPDPGSALDGVRSASETYALWLSRTICEHLGSIWGLAETGASGPTGNRYGDAPGHTCIAVSGPSEKVITIETGKSDRQANMWAFTEAALSLLAAVMEEGA
jgi:PncC family amidohydrolase